jgi:hypothetical protein
MSLRTPSVIASVAAVLAGALVPASASALSLTASATTTTTAAAATAAATTTCPTQTVRTAFSAFGDSADYAMAPGGDFESSAGWTLSGGAKIVSGNENLGVAPGSKSLSLPLGATATSPQFCIDATDPYFRFVSKPQNAMAGYQAIVIYRTAAGKVAQAQFTSSSAQSWGAGKWAPSSISPLAVKIPAVLAGTIATVQLEFVSTGNSTGLTALWGKFAMGAVGTVSIDSVMVDPYRRG